MNRIKNLEIINHDPFKYSDLYGLEQIFREKIKKLGDEELDVLRNGLSACLAKANARWYNLNELKNTNACPYKWLEKGEELGKFRKFIDHPTVLKCKNNSLLLVEPYNVTMEEFKQAITLCEKYGYSIEISSYFKSIYRPNVTTAIVIKKS